MQNPFIDLLIRIGAAPAAGRAHPVEALIDGDALFYGGTLDLDPAALRAAVLDLDAYGSALGTALLSEPIRRAWERSLTRAKERCEGRLRLRLQIDADAAVLQSLRWERLILPYRGQWVPVAIATETPLSRFTGLELDSTQPLRERPVRMLIALANPAGLDPARLTPVAVAAEVASLWDGLKDLATPATLRIAVLPGRSGLPADLAADLSAGGWTILPGVTGAATLSDLARGYHVVHLIAHGAFRAGTDGQAGTTRLLLEAADGTLDAVTDDDLTGRLAAAAPLPRLIYLAACESAVRDESAVAPFVGLGPKLVAAGVPAVVAMQDRVPMTLSTALTRRFYQSLLRHGVVDQALNEARWLLCDARAADWSIPVLFMRLDQGRLFEPDPLREALQGILQWSRDDLATRDPPLPMEVVRAPGTADAVTLDRLERAEEAGYEFVQAAQDLLLAPAPGVPPCVVLLGREGTGKTLYCRRLIGAVAELSLAAASGASWVPVPVDPTATPGPDQGPAADLEPVLWQGLRPFWPELTLAALRALLRDQTGPNFLFVVDNVAALAEAERTALFRHLGAFTARARRHRFLVVSIPQQGGEDALPVTDYLVVKSLSFRRVETYLAGLADPAGAALLEALNRHQLYDLAGLPWLLVHILKRTRLGNPPRSRTGVIKGFIDGALTGLPSGGDIRGRAPASLMALAWELQSKRTHALTLERTLEVLESVRGRREYRLMDLLDALVDAELIVRVGPDLVQFANPALQAYCCAAAIRGLADAKPVLDDITATLGRLSRLRWWADTLVLFAGMTSDLNGLISLILYGAGAGQEEQVFLAARCMEENGAADLDPLIRSQVVEALLRLTDPTWETRVQVRTRAIGALQRLREETAIPRLARIAIERVRTDWMGRSAAEYSAVRLAAIRALRAMGAPAMHWLQAQYPEFARLVQFWNQGDLAAITRSLEGVDEQIRPITAFLLGSLDTPQATAELIRQFWAIDGDPVLGWALTDALTLIDPGQVVTQVILPFIDPDLAAAAGRPAPGGNGIKYRRRQVAYLIGKVKATDPRARQFLDQCIRVLADVALKGHAIRSIGSLHDTAYKGLLEDLALGNFAGVATDAGWEDGDRAWLRLVAVETLTEIGDLDSVARLRAGRRADQGWTAVLNQALFRLGEEVSCRLWEAQEWEGARH